MSRFRLLIADDEPLARTGLARVVESEPEFDVVAQCKDGPETLAAIRRERPELVLLDVEMPGLDGFEVLAALSPEERPLTIFVTAYHEHALHAFDVNAVDYVLKPVVPDRLREALTRAAARLRAPGEGAGLSTQDLQRLAELISRARDPADYLERFLVRSAGGGVVVPVTEVRYLEADGDYVRLHRGGSHELMRATLHSLVERLDPTAFVRIHRSYVVRLEEVQEIVGGAGGEGTVLLRDGTELPLSRTYRERLLDVIDRRRR